MNKQETLEDFIKRESKSGNESIGIVKGTKWQAERMYSKFDLDAINNIPTAEEFINIGLDESGFEFYGDMKKIASKKLIQFAKLHVEAALKAVQAERMYSEEDLHNAFYNGWLYRGENYSFPKAKKEWFKQFKKK
jgi:hypothetical protein